ncbi:MAG TPA: type II toxin-antitoxin system MqsR family toxin [Longimicrobium sp.]|nr:type II toxin-antitoxin system MqsR family toxin [Longimicrobium sp.]
MGRGQPTYDLHELQRLIGQGPLSSWITQAAADGAAELDLSDDDIVDAVLRLEPQHFYKSMESASCPGLWQDVYHLEYRQTWTYIKLQRNPAGRAVVVQFNRK